LLCFVFILFFFFGYFCFCFTVTMRIFNSQRFKTLASYLIFRNNLHRLQINILYCFLPLFVAMLFIFFRWMLVCFSKMNSGKIRKRLRTYFLILFHILVSAMGRSIISFPLTLPRAALSFLWFLFFFYLSFYSRLFMLHLFIWTFLYHFVASCIFLVRFFIRMLSFFPLLFLINNNHTFF